MAKKKIGIFVASLRKMAYSRSIANWVMKNQPDNMEMEIIEIGHLPIYNQDYDDEETPPSYIEFRNKVRALDGYLFITAEHNRSIPAALKNALDVASRPFGQNAWGGKPGAIMSQSYGEIGGFGASRHLLQVLSFLDIRTMNQPECYLGKMGECLDTEGRINSERTIKFLKSIMAAYAKWIDDMSTK